MFSTHFVYTMQNIYRRGTSSLANVKNPYSNETMGLCLKLNTTMQIERQPNCMSSHILVLIIYRMTLVSLLHCHIHLPFLEIKPIADFLPGCQTTELVCKHPCLTDYGCWSDKNEINVYWL